MLDAEAEEHNIPHNAITDSIGCTRAVIYPQADHEGFTALRLRYRIQLGATERDHSLFVFYTVIDRGAQPEVEIWKSSEVAAKERVDLLLHPKVPDWLDAQFSRTCTVLRRKCRNWKNPLTSWE